MNAPAKVPDSAGRSSAYCGKPFQAAPTKRLNIGGKIDSDRLLKMRRSDFWSHSPDRWQF
jgi:hypothetical protein